MNALWAPLPTRLWPRGGQEGTPSHLGVTAASAGLSARGRCSPGPRPGVQVSGTHVVTNKGKCHGVFSQEVEPGATRQAQHHILREASQARIAFRGEDVVV